MIVSCFFLVSKSRCCSRISLCHYKYIVPLQAISRKLVYSDKSNCGFDCGKLMADASPNFEPKYLMRAQEMLIRNLVLSQDEYASPSEEDLNKVTPFTLGDSKEDDTMRFFHIIEITILNVQQIVAFAKRVPGFLTLSTQDQASLLKACTAQLMFLRAARRYDRTTDSVLFANNHAYTREHFHRVSIGELGEDIFYFCRTMRALEVGNAEYALLKTIVIFSAIPNLREPKEVERFKEFYIETLKSYTASKRPSDKNYFTRLFSLLVELKKLGDISSKRYFFLRIPIHFNKLPPCLKGKL